MVRVNRNGRVEALRWQLIAAVSGIGVAATTCAGRSSRDGERERDPNGGTSSSAGAEVGRGGKAGTGSGASAGANAGSASLGGGGSGGAAGSGGSGPELGECEMPSSWAGLVRCAGQYVHRPTATSCPYPPRDGDGGVGGEGGTAGAADARVSEFDFCDVDTDCGSNGYCAYAITDSWDCVYAECEVDADCPEGHVCACHPIDDVGSIGECVRASCTTDADCEGAALCVSPLYQGGCFGNEVSQFHCQSSEDECWGPAACEGNPGECARDATSSRFICQAGESCGRPFVVGGIARRAQAVTARDRRWSDAELGHTGVPTDLTEDERKAVARHFVEAALMEHASIAAFARFTLQLLALGAPSSLVEDAARAMADETRHAQMCFGLAERYGASSMGPGPLGMEGALDGVDLLEVVERVIVEGCIGETVAALEAAWAADQTEDPEVRRALETIAEDEARHAALAFRFAGWAAERDHRVSGLFERNVAEARRLSMDETEGSGAHAERASRLACHGVLDRSTRLEACRRALSEIVPGLVGSNGRASLYSRNSGFLG